MVPNDRVNRNINWEDNWCDKKTEDVDIQPEREREREREEGERARGYGK